MQSHRFVCPRHNIFLQLQSMSYFGCGWGYELYCVPLHVPQYILCASARSRHFCRHYHESQWDFGNKSGKSIINWIEVEMKLVWRGDSTSLHPFGKRGQSSSEVMCYTELKLSNYAVTHAKLANLVALQKPDCSWTPGLLWKRHLWPLSSLKNRRAAVESGRGQFRQLWLCFQICGMQCVNWER